MTRKRLTRKEQQAHTRHCLMTSAAKIFARRGLEQTSIDEVSEDAGYSRGAFYANFKNKEELFLAMLDERFGQRLEELDRVLETGADLEVQTRTAGADFARALSADPEWQRLFFEFAAYAARNEEFRQELVTRYQTLRDRLADAYGRRAQALGVSSPVPLADVALMTFAMANGFALEKLIEPDAVSDELYGTMLTIFFRGLRTLVKDAAAAPSAGSSSGRR
jgi:AcrR family transcriptional regulator